MSYPDAEQRIQDEYMSVVQPGAVIPASSVLGSMNVILLVSWLMLSRSVPDTTFQRSRLPVFICIACSSLCNLLYTRSVGVVGSIGVGLNSVLCTVMAVNFILVYNPRSFSRLIRVQEPATAVLPKNPHSIKKDDDGHENLESKIAIAWAPMPRSLWRRLFWVLDLLTGVRGVQWSWKHPPPADFKPPSLSRIGSTRRQRSSLFRNTAHFIIDYILIDIVKCVMIADSYFMGYPTRAAPPHIAPYISSPLGLYTYRALFGVAGAWLAIDQMFAFTVLLHVNILGPSIVGLNSSPSMFPPIWGSPRAVLRRGLRGFWGETWHQIFRMHFLSIADCIADFMLKIHPRTSAPGKQLNKQQGLSKQRARSVVRIITVFTLSGALHAAGSYTLLGPTTPWSSFLFFTLQPLGIAIQSVCSRAFAIYWPRQSESRQGVLLKQGSNLCFTVLWLWACSGFLLDDLTIGGMWMFEPVPVSLIRGLGFSKESDRMWCW